MVAQKKENEIDKQIIRDHEDLKKYKLKPFRDNNPKGIDDR